MLLNNMSSHFAVSRFLWVGLGLGLGLGLELGFRDRLRVRFLGLGLGNGKRRSGVERHHQQSKTYQGFGG